MARMSPLADPATAIEGGLYVTPPSSVGAELAKRLELEPESSHLVVGGVGAGKTSELLIAGRQLGKRLADTGDAVAYLDVSRNHDIASARLSGALVALAGLTLAGRASASADQAASKAITAVTRYAKGYTEWVEDPPYDDYDPGDYDDDPRRPVRVPGVLVPPRPPLPEDLQELLPQLKLLRTAAVPNGHAVLMFDSLDRLPNPQRFRTAVEYDLRVLKSARIGVVVVGPLRFIAGYDAEIVQLFDQTHYQVSPDLDVPTNLEFFKQVLRLRATPEILPDECLEPLTRASGGVLRDLLALAKSAGDEAYAAGHDPIVNGDVQLAVDKFGRGLAVGLDDAQVKKLKRVLHGEGFVIQGEHDLLLLERRAILAYPGPRWVVHPALVALLESRHEAA